MVNRDNNDFGKQLSDFYTESYRVHGFNSIGASWGDQVKHTIRLRAMLNTVGLPYLQDGSILDVGCGYGQLYEELYFLNPRTKLEYTGFDPCKSAITYAQSLNREIVPTSFVVTFNLFLLTKTLMYYYAVESLLKARYD